MDLTTKDLRVISSKYGLGFVKSISLIDDGMVNTNFILKTKKGKFILRILRKNVDKKYIEERDFEFKILNFLKESKYPYEIPIPLVDKNGSIISDIKGRKYWIYKYIEGKKVRRLNNLQVEEIARAISKYHFIVSKIKGGKSKTHNSNWLVKKYAKLERVKENNLLNRTMLKHFDYFNLCLNNISRLDFSSKKLPVHADFHQNNILFKGDKVVGILDFDNIGWAVKAKDLAICMKSVCRSDKGQELDSKKIRIFLKEYKKYESLTKRDINMIKPLMVRNYCIIFLWAYEGDIKDSRKRPKMIEHAYNRLRALEEISIK